MHVCLAVTCHLHFWQNDQGPLHATAVAQGGNGYKISDSTESYSEEENSPTTPARDKNCAVPKSCVLPLCCTPPPPHLSATVNDVC